MKKRRYILKSLLAQRDAAVKNMRHAVLDADEMRRRLDSLVKIRRHYPTSDDPLGDRTYVTVCFVDEHNHYNRAAILHEVVRQLADKMGLTSDVATLNMLRTYRDCELEMMRKTMIPPSIMREMANRVTGMTAAEWAATVQQERKKHERTDRTAATPARSAPQETLGQVHCPGEGSGR